MMYMKNKILDGIDENLKFRLHHSHHNLVQQELCTIENKNPFRHVGNVFLNKSYQDIGKKDEQLKAQKFSGEYNLISSKTF